MRRASEPVAQSHLADALARAAPSGRAAAKKGGPSRVPQRASANEFFAGGGACPEDRASPRTADQLLLPDDREPLTDRTEALTDRTEEDRIVHRKAYGKKASSGETPLHTHFGSPKKAGGKPEPDICSPSFDPAWQGRHVRLDPTCTTAVFSSGPGGGKVRGRLSTVVLSAPLDPRRRVFRWTVELRGRTMVGVVPEHELDDFLDEPAGSVWAFVTRSSGTGYGLRRWGQTTLLCSRRIEIRLPPTSSRVTCELDLARRTLTFEDDGQPIPGGIVEDLDPCTYRLAAAVGSDGASVTLI